jgi:two-component system, NtrC family, nitrogen regulation response regulator GlnG
MSAINPLHILIVEDDPFVRETSSWMLEAEGFVVHSATNALEAWDAINARQPEVLLTDINMPGENGDELAARVATQFPDIPIILTSGVTLPTANGHCYLPKPYDRAGLIKAVYEAANDTE